MADYVSTLTGPQMDAALLDMAEHSSEAYAVGERNGIAVASDDVTYHNNARYYAQIASSQIVGDASSAVRWDTDQSEALTDAQKAQARENINAASDSDVVKITAQTLTSAEQEQARANIMAGGSNENLLDNAYFVGGGSQLGNGVFPINQRGLSNYGAGYTIDRWKLSSGGTLVFTNDGISINGLFFQKKVIDFTVGETYTLSRQTTDGNVVSVTGVVPSTEGWMIGDQNFGVYFRPSTKVCDIQIWGTYLLKAVKLEKGTVSTLANDPVPDFGEELRKCLRYLCKSHPLNTPVSQFDQSVSSLGTARNNGGFFVTFPVEMASTPQVLKVGHAYCFAALDDGSEGTTYDPYIKPSVISTKGFFIANSFYAGFATYGFTWYATCEL